MQKRVHIKSANPAAYQALLALNKVVEEGNVDKKLLDLINVRAAQINGCAYCIDIHTRDARMGETEQRIYALSAWRETPFFTDAERAVLALTESITLIASHRVSDEVYSEVTRHFSEAETATLIMAIININALTRIGVATNLMPVKREAVLEK